MREASTESNAQKKLDRLGFLFLKLPAFSYVGIPDRLLIGPYRLIVFVEMKREKKEPTKIQLHWHRLLRGYGFRVEVCYSYDDILGIIDDEIQIAQAKKTIN